MAHVYKVSNWQGGSGRWYCNDITDLAGVSAKWWVPARMLRMQLTDYILLLKDTFHATIDGYNPEKDVLLFHWNNYGPCNEYTKWINSMARKANFLV